ncbi:glycosyltransferase [Saccharothrix isguenensis]
MSGKGEALWKGPLHDHVVVLERVTRCKGQHIAVRVARELGWPLVLAGPVGRFHARDDLERALATDPAVRANLDVRYWCDEVEPHVDGRRVSWVGTVRGRERDRLLAITTAALFPITWSEPGGTAVVEALALGCPVVGFRRGWLPELLDHGRTGLLAEPAEEAVLARARRDVIRITGIVLFGPPGARSAAVVTCWFTLSGTIDAAMRRNFRRHVGSGVCPVVRPGNSETVSALRKQGTGGWTVSTVDLPRDGVDLDLPDTPPTPTELSELVAGTFPEVGDDRLVDILVVAAQLVGNAYRHARAPRRLRLHRSGDGDVVRVEVNDASPSRFPVLGRLDTPEHGRGLLMVNRLSVNWGHRPRRDHKTVWAEVRLV